MIGCPWPAKWAVWAGALSVLIVASAGDHALLYACFMLKYLLNCPPDETEDDRTMPYVTIDLSWVSYKYGYSDGAT